MKINFLGATGTVTGSKYLLELRGKKILVDCGLFQGLKELRLLNRASLSVDPRSIDAVILTHAHLDHSGYIPLLVKNGFKGTIYCTEATYDLCTLLLPDSGHIQEEDTRHANKYGYSKHKPALPLYTEEDARNSLRQFKPLNFKTQYHIDNKIFFSFTPVGHILGASYLRVSDGDKTITFSGDIGRFNDPIMKDPEALEPTDYLVLESTYGDRLHDHTDIQTQIAKIINETTAKGGSIIIPAFAVGRAQSILYHLYHLKAKKIIADIPVYLDSPMATSVTDFFCKYFKLHKLSQQEAKDVCNVATYIQSVEESKSIDNNHYPSIIISASGMASGGRVLHHLKSFVGDHRNTVLFAGFQAAGTRGRAMLEGARSIKIHGQNYEIRARVENLAGASAHADYKEILIWLRNLKQGPQQIFITHGEPEAAEALEQKIHKQFGWNVIVPKYLESFGL